MKAKKYSANATRMAEDIPPNLVLTLDQWAARDLPQPDYPLGEMFSTTTRQNPFRPRRGYAHGTR